MKIIIRSKIELGSAKEKIEKKFRSLEKFLIRLEEEKEEVRLEIEISQDAKHNTGDIYFVEANLFLSKADILRTVDKADNLFLAVKKVFIELKRQIRKRKTVLARIRKGAQKIKKLIHR